MARIVGVDIPNDKRVVVSITYIYGIGDTLAKQICKDAKVSEEIRVKDLTQEQLSAIRQELQNTKLSDLLVKSLSILTFTKWVLSV